MNQRCLWQHHKTYCMQFSKTWESPKKASRGRVFHFSDKVINKITLSNIEMRHFLYPNIFLFKNNFSVIVPKTRLYFYLHLHGGYNENFIGKVQFLVQLTHSLWFTIFEPSKTGFMSQNHITYCKYFYFTLYIFTANFFGISLAQQENNKVVVYFFGPNKRFWLEIRILQKIKIRRNCNCKWTNFSIKIRVWIRQPCKGSNVKKNSIWWDQCRDRNIFSLKVYDS